MLLPIWPGTGRTLVDPLQGAEGPFVAVGAAPVVNKDQALLYFFFSFCLDAVFGSMD